MTSNEEMFAAVFGRHRGSPQPVQSPKEVAADGLKAAHAAYLRTREHRNKAEYEAREAGLTSSEISALCRAAKAEVGIR